MPSLFRSILTIVAILLLASIAGADVLVPPTVVVMSNGDTVRVQMDISISGTITITETVLTSDTTKQWTTVTQINPSDPGGNPKVTVSYTPPKPKPEPDPYDVNRDGSVNYLDFLAVFRIILFR